MNKTVYVLEFDESTEMYIHDERTVLSLIRLYLIK